MITVRVDATRSGPLPTRDVEAVGPLLDGQAEGAQRGREHADAVRLLDAQFGRVAHLQATGGQCAGEREHRDTWSFRPEYDHRIRRDAHDAPGGLTPAAVYRRLS